MVSSGNSSLPESMLTQIHNAIWLITVVGYEERYVPTHYQVARRVNLTVYPTKYAHGFCFAVLCCGFTLTDFPISIRLTSLALWQSNDCPSASKATLMNMDKYFMWIHYERLHNHNKAKHNKTMCIFLGIYCTCKAYVLLWIGIGEATLNNMTNFDKSFIYFYRRKQNKTHCMFYYLYCNIHMMALIPAHIHRISQRSKYRKRNSAWIID